MTFDQWYELQNKGHSDEDKADMRAAWDAALDAADAEILKAVMANDMTINTPEGMEQVGWVWRLTAEFNKPWGPGPWDFIRIPTSYMTKSPSMYEVAPVFIYKDRT